MNNHDHKQELESCCLSSAGKRPWYQNKTLIVLAGILGLLAISLVVPALEPFRFHFLMYVRMIWWAILLGLFLSGLIEYFVPQEYIGHYLSQPRKRTILYSVGLSFLACVCSCGVLTLSMQLYKKGASTSAVVAFLLSSPWANFPLMLMLIGFWGFTRTLFFVGAAIVIALTTGLIYQQLEKKNLVECNTRSVVPDEGFSMGKDLTARLRNFSWSPNSIQEMVRGVARGIAEISDMVLWWMLIGMVLASLIGAYVPTGIFQQYMGPTWGGMLVTLALATVIEVCSEGTSPVAYEIFRKTGALGNSFVFLMGGVVTDYTEIGLLWHNIGRRTALWFPLITVPQVLLFGWLANKLFR